MYYNIIYTSDQDSSGNEEQPRNVYNVFDEDEPAIVIEPSDVKLEPSDDEVDNKGAETAVDPVNMKAKSYDDKLDKKKGQTVIDPLEERAKKRYGINNRRVNRVSWRQLEILWEFLNSNRGIAMAYNRALQDKEYSQRKWREIAKILNSQADGTRKDWAGWNKPPEIAAALIDVDMEDSPASESVRDPPFLTTQNPPPELMVQDSPACSPSRTPTRSPRPATTSAARSSRHRRRKREPPMSQEAARRSLVRSTQMHAEAAVRSAEAMEKSVKILGEFRNTAMRIERMLSAVFATLTEHEHSE